MGNAATAKKGDPAENGKISFYIILLLNTFVINISKN